jgi:hypothetical protein
MLIDPKDLVYTYLYMEFVILCVGVVYLSLLCYTFWDLYKIFADLCPVLYKEGMETTVASHCICSLCVARKLS